METELPKRKFIIPKEIWAKIGEGVKLGVPFDELSRKYCVNEATIRQKSSKMRWTVPRKLENECQRQASFDAETRLSSGNMTDSEKKLSSPPAPMDWTTTAARYREMVFTKVSSKLEQAEIEPPKTWRDAEIADRMARKAAGLESGEHTVVQTILPIGTGDFGVERDVTGT